MPYAWLQTLVLASVAFQTRGVIVNTDGQPLNGGTALTVVAIDHKPKEHSTPIDSTGHFELGDLTYNGILGEKREVVYILTPDHRSFAAIQQDDGVSFKSVPSTHAEFRVLGKDGTPIPGAAVSFSYANFDINGQWTHIYFPPDLQADWSATTDAAGRCSVQVVVANGLSRVSVKARGYADQSVDLPVEGLKALVLTKEAIIRGRVLSVAGKPSPNVWVNVSSPSGSRQFKTDGAGRFVAGGLMPGVYDLYPIRGFESPWVPKPRTGLLAAEGQAIEGIDLQLQKGVQVKGQIVTMESNAPFAGATVEVVPGRSAEQVAVTGRDGRFQVYVPPGPIEAFVIDTPAGRPDVPYVFTEVVDAGIAPEILLRIPAALQNASLSQVSGFVMDASGAPASGAEVQILADFGMRTLTTDDKGRFLFKGKVSWNAKFRAIKGAAATTEEIPLKSGTGVTLKLTDHAPARLSGRCLTDAGGVAADLPVSVSLVEGGTGFPVKQAQTDRNGDFSVEGLIPGTYEASISQEGYVYASSEAVKLGPGETKAFRIVLRAEAFSVSGKLVGDTGKPVSGAVIGCADSEATQTATDASGNFTLKQVSQGTNAVTVTMRDGAVFLPVKDGIVRLPYTTAVPAGMAQRGPEQLIGIVPKEIRASRWLNSSPLRLAALKGKIVVLDFWGTWCAPCCATLPDVQKFSKQYPGDVVVIGVVVPPIPHDRIDAFVRGRGLTYPQALDKDKSGYGETTAQYAVGMNPTVIVIGRDGKVVSVGNSIKDAALVAKMVQRH